MNTIGRSVTAPAVFSFRGVVYMDQGQKQRIIEMRNSGCGYKEISNQLQISVNTVKSYCKRHNIARIEKRNSSAVRFCLQCGNEIKQEQHRKTKKFCSDRCRMIWWREHSSLLRTPSKQTFICPICHEAFSAYSSTKQKYCSRLCYARSREVSHE